MALTGSKTSWATLMLDLTLSIKLVKNAVLKNAVGPFFLVYSANVCDPSWAAWRCVSNIYGSRVGEIKLIFDILIGIVKNNKGLSFYRFQCSFYFINECCDFCKGACFVDFICVYVSWIHLCQFWRNTGKLSLERKIVKTALTPKWTRLSDYLVKIYSAASA